MISIRAWILFYFWINSMCSRFEERQIYRRCMRWCNVWLVWGTIMLSTRIPISPYPGYQSQIMVPRVRSPSHHASSCQNNPNTFRVCGPSSYVRQQTLLQWGFQADVFVSRLFFLDEVLPHSNNDGWSFWLHHKSYGYLPSWGCLGRFRIKIDLNST